MIKNKANNLYSQYYVLLLDNDKAIDSAIICIENIMQEPVANRVFWKKVIKELKNYEREERKEQSDMFDTGTTL